MNAINSAPASTRMKPRNLSFALDVELQGDWCAGDAFRTAWFNALSYTFPIGERFFIDSVRYYKAQVTDPQLLADVRDFVGQESLHSREHQLFNDTLCALRGYDQAYLESLSIADDEARRRCGPEVCLAHTVALEHLFAYLGVHVLKRCDGSIFPLDSRVSDMWLWHAYEEAEHCHVAFDVYQAAGLPTSLRRRALVYSMVKLMRIQVRSVWHMLRPLPFWRRVTTCTKGVGFLLGPIGLNWHLVRSCAQYWRRDFHPLQQHELPAAAHAQLETIVTRYAANAAIP